MLQRAPSAPSSALSSQTCPGLVNPEMEQGKQRQPASALSRLATRGGESSGSLFLSSYAEDKQRKYRYRKQRRQMILKVFLAMVLLTIFVLLSTKLDQLYNTIDPLDQLLSKYDIPVSALDCDGGEQVVSSYPPPRLYPNGSTVLCAIVLNEKPYIDEFVNYHLGLGFSKIVVYDNSESNKLREWQRHEQTSPMVEVIHFPGLNQQGHAYLDCAQSAFNGEFGENKKWAAFFDVDEFLVLKKHEYVDKLLEEHLPKLSGSLSINWAMFNFNGKLLCDAKPVTKRFGYRDQAVDPHVKSIVRLEDMQMNAEPLPHYPHLKNGNQHDTNGKVFWGPFNKNGPLDVAAIHHYHKKSFGEYVKKRQRGRADYIDSETERMEVLSEAIKLFEGALEKNSSDEISLLAETDVVFDDSAWTLL